MLTAALLVCAFVAGVTGTWSPCGLSMIETLAPRGRARPAALVTFALGALAGGAAGFAALGALGGVLGVESEAALLVAAAVALAAAVADARALPIRPQVRRQVPESWRRVLPLPVAGGLYGVLLGLGWTTFVLTFAVWALLIIAVAHGMALAGLLAGLAFAAGRALPVLVLAPLQGSDAGARATEAMAGRPELLRRLRALDAVALTWVAVVLAIAGLEGSAQAQAQAWTVTLTARAATDPSAAGTAVAWQDVASGGGIVKPAPDQAPVALQGALPALSPARLATLNRSSGQIEVHDRASGQLLAAVAPGDGTLDALAVSDGWLAWRVVTPDGADALRAVDLADPARTVRPITSARAGTQLGRPALDGTRVVFHVAGRRTSYLREIDLATGTLRLLRRARPNTQVLNPSIRGERLAYVRVTRTRQELVVGDRVVYAIAAPNRPDAGREPGRDPHVRGASDRYPRDRRRPRATVTLWTTGLADDAVYVTRLRSARGQTAASVLRVTP